MAFRNFIYTKDDEDLTFLPKEPSLSFGTGSPSVLVNTKPLKANEESDIPPVEIGSVKLEGSSRPPVKRKFASGSSTFCATRAKTSFSMDDAPFLKLFDDDEGLLDVLEHKDANAFHLKIFSITPPAWKSHLDNHIDLELLGRELGMKSVMGWVKCEAAMTDFKKNPVVVALREKVYALSIEAKEHKLSLDRMMLESQKRACYQQSLSTLESKFTSLKTEKARLEAVEVSLRKEVEELKQDKREVVSKVVPYAAMELVHSDDMGNLVGKLVSSAIVYGRCRFFKLVAGMKEPFDLSKVKGYRSSYKKDHTQASNDFATATFP
nr:hypothetical protein [Tanacetum cinerariifolium]